MRTPYKILSILILLGTCPLAGMAQAGFYNNDRLAGCVKVEPVQFAEVGDSLHLKMDISVRADALNSREALSIVPVLATGPEDNVIVFPRMLVNGHIRKKDFRRMERFENEKLLKEYPSIKIDLPLSADTIIRYYIEIPYELWMDTATLEIHQYLHSPADKIQLFSTVGFGKVSLMPREPYRIEPLVNFIVPDREDKQRRVQGQAFLDFQVGRSTIIPGFRRNPEELEKIRAAVSKIAADPDINITSLYIEGYASPEGSYALNERLSRERAVALKDYMVSNFGLPESIFRVSSVAEDWDGLREAVRHSNIPQKENIYKIIDSHDDYDRKEFKLKLLGGPWRTMLTEIFPELRRVEYQIDFSVKDFTIEESEELLKRNPELLSQRELFVLAESYPAGSEERTGIIEMIFRTYPDDITAIANSAAAMLVRDEDATAKRYLDRADNSPLIYNNLGVYYLKAGDLDRARELFIMAQDKGVVEAAHNLEELQRKHEDNIIMERYKR